MKTLDIIHNIISRERLRDWLDNIYADVESVYTGLRSNGCSEVEAAVLTSKYIERRYRFRGTCRVLAEQYLDMIYERDADVADSED